METAVGAGGWRGTEKDTKREKKEAGGGTCSEASAS